MTSLPPPADLDRRLTAFLLDRLVVAVVALAVALPVGVLVLDGVVPTLLLLAACLLVVEALGAVLLGVRGTTPGKAAVGLRVERVDDGRPIGVPAALARVAVLVVSGLPTAGLGLATLAWTAAADPGGRRRALHDRIGDAIVVDARWAAPAPVVDDAPVPALVNLTALRLLPPPPPMSAVPEALPDAAPAPVPGVPLPVGAAEQTRVRGAVPPTAPVVPPPPAPPRVSWLVRFDTGESLVLEGLALVGRRPEPRPGEEVRHLVPLASSDMSLSKTHAQLQVAPDGALVVMDRGSTNGSFLVRRGHSRALVPGRPSTLVSGDVVRLGDRSLQVEREA